MKTPVNNGILQSDLDFVGLKPLGANLADYAGANMTWNAVTGKLDATGSGSGGGGGGTVLHTYDVKADYGAAGDGRTRFDFVANGTTTLTSATAAFTAADTGKTIAVEGVGSGGFPLVGTITFVNATTVTCSVAASSSGTGKRGMVGTDDTTAFQNAINAVDNAGGGKIFIPDGNYLIAGAIQTAPTGIASPYGKGQLILPTRNLTSQAEINIEFEGAHIPAPNTNWTAETPPLTATGAIICSFANGATGQEGLFSGGPPLGYTWPFAGINVKFKNLILRTYANPKLTPLNLSRIGQATVENVVVDTGTVLANVTPNTNNGTGIYMPENSNWTISRLVNVDAIGYSIGYYFNEHTVIDDGRVWLCSTGFQLGSTYHLAQIGKILAVGCTTNFKVIGSSRFVIDLFSIEHTAFGDWRDTVTDISDPSNVGYGIINVGTVLSNVGTTSTLTVSGGANLNIRNLQLNQNTIYVGSDARLVPITGGVKLEVRNPGTNTWATGDQWTNP